MENNNKCISILGCGWLGLPLAKELIAQGYTVKGSVRTATSCKTLQGLGIVPFVIDLDQDGPLEPLFFETDVVIVAIPSKNVNGFKKLIKQLEKSAVRKVIFSSSTSVYASSNAPITEVCPTLDTPLVKIEQLLLTASIFETSILRFGGLIGPKRNPGNFFKGGKLVKNPLGVVNMIHLQDCIAIIQRLLKIGIESQIFNACTDEHPTRKEFYTKARLLLGKEPPNFEKDAPPSCKVISSEKLKKELGYEFIYGLS